MFGYVRPVKRLDNREREARGVLPVYPLPLTLTVGERRLERRLGPRGYERASWTPQRDRSPGRSPSRTLRPMTVLSGPRARRARSGLRRRVSDAVVLSGPFWPASGAFRLHDHLTESGRVLSVAERQLGRGRMVALHALAAKSCHWSGTPRRVLRPRSSNCRPDPATKSLIVRDTRTSPGAAQLITRAAMCTAIPAMSSLSSSTSPACRPA